VPSSSSLNALLLDLEFDSGPLQGKLTFRQSVLREQ
jgi:hypothetical protein